jgi:hypothetical protein
LCPQSLPSPASGAGELERGDSDYHFQIPLCRELMQIICQQLAPAGAKMKIAPIDERAQFII